jgi:hypothetical protein
MKTTTNYGFEYPEGGDTPDLGYWNKRLADAVDAALLAAAGDTGWVDVTVSSGFVPQAGTEKPQVRRIGKVVFTRGGWLTGAGNGITAANSTYNVGTVPAGFRPVGAPTVGAAGSSSGAAVGGLHIDTAGIVQVRTPATLGAYYKMDRQSYPLD